jgi:hypothetical protein
LVQNHSTETGKIRALRSLAKSDKYGVWRMKMLAISSALADNQDQINRIVGRHAKKKHLIINIRSDSKTSVEQLRGISGTRDKVLQKT